MTSKRVLLIGGNCSPELTGIGKYNGEMIDWLAANGYQCAVLTTFPYYPQWKVQDAYAKAASWYQTEKTTKQGCEIVTIHRCPHYVPRNPSGLKRVISDASFFLSALLRLIPLLFTKKYDIVLTVVPPFHVGLLGVLYKAVKGATFLYHVQDLQIEAAEHLGMIRSKKMLRFLYGTEAYILRKADLVSTISAGMLKKVQAKINAKVQLFPNWVDTALFYPLADTETLKKEFGFEASDKIVLYSGAIGEKQGLESILEAAKALASHQDIRFVICGSGPYKEKLESKKDHLGLTNVTFLPLQPMEKLNAFLNMADVHLVLQKADAADLVMPSKLTTVLAIGGLAIVTANAGTSLADTVSENNMGIVVPPENQECLNEAILQALSTVYAAVKENARKYAQETISIDGVFQTFLNVMNTTCGHAADESPFPNRQPRSSETVM